MGRSKRDVRVLSSTIEVCEIVEICELETYRAVRQVGATHHRRPTREMCEIDASNTWSSPGSRAGSSKRWVQHATAKIVELKLLCW